MLPIEKQSLKKKLSWRQRASALAPSVSPPWKLPRINIAQAPPSSPSRHLLHAVHIVHDLEAGQYGYLS